ncbi:hypothetical protein MRX96_010540 [Rhipicephalus microplus]
MLGVLRGRTPLGASVGQNPAVVFYVATMFTLIVLVMHVWLRKHSEEMASRQAAQQQRLSRHQGSGRHRGGSALNDTEGTDDGYNDPDTAVADAVEDEFFLATRPLGKGNVSINVANVKLSSGSLRGTLDDREDLNETTWFIKWLKKKLGISGWERTSVKT